jgi:hypothetical protein
MCRCYKSLIAGYLHYGISDLTGFSAQQIILKPGFTGYDKHTLKLETDKDGDTLWSKKKLENTHIRGGRRGEETEEGQVYCMCVLMLNVCFVCV